MENKTQNTIFILIIIALLAVASLVFYQQIEIKALKKQLFSSSITNQINQEKQKSAPEFATSTPAYLLEAVRNSIIDNMKEITGALTQVEGNVLTVEAEIMDLNKIDKVDYSPAEVPKIKKTYKVTINKDTPNLVKGAPEFKTGQPIRVFANELIYKTQELTAAKIIYPFIIKEKK